MPSIKDKCPECEHESITIKVIEHRFEYGADTNSAWLSATVPVFVCDNPDCKLEYLDQCGSALIDHAIAKHLGKS
jgi:hypothetical protein